MGIETEQLRNERMGLVDRLEVLLNEHLEASKQGDRVKNNEVVAEMEKINGRLINIDRTIREIGDSNDR